MPRKYVRKVGARPRGMWSEDALNLAFEELKENKKLMEVARRYGIPPRTLRRRFQKQDAKKLTLGGYLSLFQE